MMRLSSILLLLPMLLTGQGRIGGWSSHVSFKPVILVEEMPDYIVAATSNGIFLVSKKDFQMTTTTKVEGLSDTGITAIAYASEPDLLIIGYQSGNLDLLQNGKIRNLSDLTRKAGLPDKSIHRIICEGSIAYLCCAFGIVKIDLKRVEVAETWYLGPKDNLKETFDLLSFNGYWWIASGSGIYKAEKQNINLQDYRNWQFQPNLPAPEAIFGSLALSDNLLFAQDLTNDRILSWNGKNWQVWLSDMKNIKRIKSLNKGVMVLANNEIRVISNTGTMMINGYGEDNTTFSPSDALISSTSEYWIADYANGLTRRKSNSSFLHYIPNSPESDLISALRSGQDEIFVGTYSVNSSGLPGASYSIRHSGTWQNFNFTSDPELKSIRPITDFAISANHPGEYWASTAGSGLLFFQNNRVATRYSDLNSTLGAQGNSCMVNGISLDAGNTLWYTNPTGKTLLGNCSASGAFVSLPFPGTEQPSLLAGKILSTYNGTHWVILSDDALFAFKIKGSAANSSGDQYRKIAVQSRFSNSTTTLINRFTGISTLAEDLNHQLWVGTASGIVVYNDPEKVFDPAELYGSQPSLNDGEAVFKPILEKEKITSIAVDGGNRKWIGTASSGVFLFSEQGDHLLKHFDTKNSPLLSDKVVSIAIQQKTGEVFFATSSGLISYIGDATIAESGFERAYVWPNPLRENFEGGVTMDGLVDGTELKITDLAGNLLFHTTSIGGRSFWNARNAMGSRVATGVYLIICSSPRSGSSKILKLLVIH